MQNNIQYIEEDTICSLFFKNVKTHFVSNCTLNATHTTDLNQSDYPTTIVIPLTTSLIDDAKLIIMRILKKDKLLKDSDLILTQSRSIDNSRMIEKITTLIHEEYLKLKHLFQELVD